MSGEIVPPGPGNMDPSSQGPDDHTPELAYIDQYIKDLLPDFMGVEENERRMAAEAEAKAAKGTRDFVSAFDQSMPRTDPQTAEEVLRARGVTTNIWEAELFCRDEGYKRVFERALDQGDYNPNGLAISEAHVFALSILPYLPPSNVIFTSRSAVDIAWVNRSLNILGATQSPKDYLEALWQPDDLLGELTDAGRDLPELQECLERERDLLGNLHFLASDRQFVQAKEAIAPGSKNISTAAFNITTYGKGGFSEWVQKQPEIRDKSITWCNLGNFGDHFYFPLVNTVKQPELPPDRVVIDPMRKIHFDPNCTFVASSQVRYDGTDPFIGELRLDLPPLAYSSIGGTAFAKQIMRGLTAYNA